MARILGVEIPNNKKIEYSLRYVYGVGPTRSKEVLAAAGIDVDRRTHELSEEELNQIVEVIQQKGFLVEGELRREISNNLKRLAAIRAYRALRHQRGLPSRGQRTKTNARTRKNARRGSAIVRK